MMPRILGHRGASARETENTLQAFGRARADGADGVEYDVQLSRDGHPVVFHDEDLGRMSARHGRLDALDLLDLEAVPLRGSESALRRIPRLEQVLERVPGIHDLEIKLPDDPIPATLRTSLVLACVRAFGAVRRAGGIHPDSLLTSFDLAALDLVSRLAPELRFGVLVDDLAGWERLRAWRPARRPAVLALRASLAPLVLDRKERCPEVVRRSEPWFWAVPEDDPVPLLRWRPGALIVDDPLAVRNRLRG